MVTKRFNKGTELGRNLIKRSIQEFGCGRSVLADKDNNIICGHDVYEIAKKLGKKVIVVETNGDAIVVVKRTDISANDTIGLNLQFLDNLSHEKNQKWDANTLIETMNSNFSFDPRRWGGDGCLVEEFDIQQLFKDDIIVQPRKIKKSVETSNIIQTTLFD